MLCQNNDKIGHHGNVIMVSLVTFQKVTIFKGIGDCGTCIHLSLADNLHIVDVIRLPIPIG
jgi:hypothetical protein